MGIISCAKDIIASNLNKMAEATTAKLTPILQYLVIYLIYQNAKYISITR
jgi:hypothetical protein